MNATVTNCAACREPTEAPFTRRLDPAGNPTGEVLCLDCHDAMLRLLLRLSDRREPLGGGD